MRGNAPWLSHYRSKAAATWPGTASESQSTTPMAGSELCRKSRATPLQAKAREYCTTTFLINPHYFPRRPLNARLILTQLVPFCRHGRFCRRTRGLRRLQFPEQRSECGRLDQETEQHNRVGGHCEKLTLRERRQGQY